MRDVATMKEKAQAWVGNLLGWGRRRQNGSAEKLYAEAQNEKTDPSSDESDDVVEGEVIEDE